MNRCKNGPGRLLLMLLVIGLMLMGCGERRESDPDWLLHYGTSFDKTVYITKLARSGDPARVAKIARFLTDPDPDIVGKAAWYIGDLHARAYIPTLVALLNSKDSTVVNMAGAGLREMVDDRDTALLPKLYPLLEHEFLLARISAIECIGAIRSRTSTEILLSKLSSEEPGAQAYIIRALGDIKDPKALPALEARLLAVKAMDHSIPDRGGRRGDVPHPDLMQSILESAIGSIRGDMEQSAPTP